MRKMWSTLFGTAILAFMLCLTGLVMTGEAQLERFKDQGDGTVTDTFSGLRWSKDANPIGKRTWHDAIRACENFSIAGTGNWKLPTSSDLLFLYHGLQYFEYSFTGIQSSYYWTYNESIVNMASGEVIGNFDTTRDNHVWCVLKP